MSLNIPTDWLETILGDVCTDPQYGYTTKAASTGNLRLLRTTDITSGGIDWSSVPYCSDNPAMVEKYIIKDGDVVIARAGSVGESYLIKKPEKAVFASYLIRFRPLLNEAYFYYFLKSPFFWREISEKTLGIAIPNVNATKLKTVFLPLPASSEQKKIVEIVEELFSDLDNAIENLKKAQEQIKVFRLSVLKDGFDGRLTKEWRKLHKSTKTGKAILSDIIRHTKQPLLDLEDTVDIPKKWAYTSIVNLVVREKHSLKRGPFGSSIKKSFFVLSGYKVYEQQNAIKNDCKLGRYYIDEAKYKELEQFAVYPGDFIVSCAGTIGCIAEVPEGAEAGVINQALLKIKVDTDILDKKFFLYQFELYVERFMRASSRGSAMKNMSSVKELKQIPFVFTSIDEQRQIVTEIESRFSVCDKLEDSIDENLQKAEALRQSILKQAFEGKLTEQWRNDHRDLISGENSAEALLKKIKTEKEALQVKSKGRKEHD